MENKLEILKLKDNVNYLSNKLDYLEKMIQEQNVEINNVICDYENRIIEINTNTSIVLDIPCSATGTSITASIAALKRSKAILKGWTITN